MLALLGELMHGDYNTHVGPGLLDSGTNYQLSKALWSSLNDHNYWELQHSFQRDEDMYGNLTMLNFLGNHDQCRVHSRLTNAREHYKLAAASLLLARGVPEATIKKWSSDPQVKYDAATADATGKAKGSIFDALEDLDYQACLERCVAISKA